jgi:hypothetical protein
MGSPYLSSNETILLSTHNIVINTIAAEAILTSHRLMLLDFSHPQILPQDIPLASIETVTIGENSEKVPVLSLSIAAPDGTRNTIGMTFIPVQRTKRIAERDDWAKKLKEMSMEAQQEKGVVPAGLMPPWVPGELPVDPGKEKEKTGQSENVYRPLKPAQKHGRSADKPQKNRTLALGAGILILIIAVVLGSYVLTPSLWGKPAAVVPTTVPTPVSTTVVTTVPTPEPVETTIPVTTATPAGTIPATTAVTPTAEPQVLIPQTGVWIRITYEGKFTGSVGTAGGLKEVTGKGQGLYQIPVTEGMLLASVEKLDNSGNPLTVEFYKDGVLVKSSTTKAPKGSIEAQAELPVANKVIIVRPSA